MTAAGGQGRAGMVTSESLPVDSITWDTAAWTLARGRPVAIRALSSDSLVDAFVTDVPGVLGRIRLVIRDRASWDSLWTQITAHDHWGGPCCRTPPVIDFARQTVLAAGNGYQPGGHDIEIVRVSASRDTLYAPVLTSADMPPECSNDSGRNALAIVRIPRTAAHVVFLEGRRNGQCGRKAL
jgi:hypothetical protein